MLDPDPDPYQMNTVRICIADSATMHNTASFLRQGLYKFLLKPKKLDPWIVFPLTE
jgi:hypothetical protein